MRFLMFTSLGTRFFSLTHGQICVCFKKIHSSSFSNPFLREAISDSFFFQKKDSLEIFRLSMAGASRSWKLLGGLGIFGALPNAAGESLRSIACCT